MNKSEAMKRYWRHIRALQYRECVCQEAARKYFKPISRALFECAHADSDEGFLNAERGIEDIVALMKTYDRLLQSRRTTDI